MLEKPVKEIDHPAEEALEKMRNKEEINGDKENVVCSGGLITEPECVQRYFSIAKLVTLSYILFMLKGILYPLKGN